MARAATTADAFNAVAEPRRRQILDVLAGGERPVNDLVALLGLAQPLVSKHLRVLREVGLVDVRDEGRQRIYRLNGHSLKPIHDWVKNYERSWTERFDAAGCRVGGTQGERRKEMVAVTSSGTAVVTLPTDTQILITREFDAPKHLVYKAWTTPELIKRWWSGDRGEVTSVEVDLRVGGTWRYVMVANGGFEVAFHGEYREIVPNERVVTTEVYEGVPENATGTWCARTRSPKRTVAPPSRSSSITRARRSATWSWTPAWKAACRRRWTTSSRWRRRFAEQAPHHGPPGPDPGGPSRRPPVPAGVG